MNTNNQAAGDDLAPVQRPLPAVQQAQQEQVNEEAEQGEQVNGQDEVSPRDLDFESVGDDNQPISDDHQGHAFANGQYLSRRVVDPLQQPPLRAVQHAQDEREEQLNEKEREQVEQDDEQVKVVEQVVQETTIQDNSVAGLACLVHVIQEVLTLGITGTCPHCTRTTLKEEGCCCIRCPCGSKWCFYCGNTILFNICDTCQQAGSTPAANWVDREEEKEFKFRRTLYFLKRVKDSVAPSLWRKLKKNHNTILSSLATDQHSAWRLVVRARQPKLFGKTTLKDVAWLVPFDKAIGDFHKNTNNEFVPQKHDLLGTENCSVTTFWFVSSMIALTYPELKLSYEEVRKKL